MDIFLQQMVTGVSLGGIYALVALCIVLIYKSTQVFNFAVGEFLIVGAFCCWTFAIGLGVPVWLSLIFTFVAGGLLGFVVERLFLRPLIGQPILASVMMCICLMGFLRGLALLGWGATLRIYTPPILPKGAVHLGNAIVSQEYLWGLGITVAVVLVLIIFFRTRYGLTMKCTSEDQQLAQSIGIPVHNVFSQSWIISGAIAALGGIVLASLYTVDYEIGAIGLTAFAVVLLGGVESLTGAVVAGLIIGICEGLATGYIDPIVGGGIRDVFPFVVAIIVLFFRPYGLFGWRTIERV